MHDPKFVEGTTYIINVPPSWILGGTVVAADDTAVTFKDCVYVESIGNGHSALGSIPVAKTAKALTEAATRCYGIPDGMVVRRDAILISVPCVRDLRPLAGQQDAAEIKKAAGK